MPNFESDVVAEDLLQKPLAASNDDDCEGHSILPAFLWVALILSAGCVGWYS